MSPVEQGPPRWFTFLARVAVATVAGFAFAASGGAASTPHTEIASLPAALQGVVSATVGANDQAYRVAPDGAQFRVENARHGFVATIGPKGLAVRAGGGDWRLRLVGWGGGEARQAISTGAVVASANRVEIERGGVREWWVNGPLGLEQGWTVRSRPTRGDHGPLTLRLAQSGSLRGTVGADDRTLAVADGLSRTVLRYAGLAAYDATGRELAGRFEVDGRDILVRVDDATATYPVRIDPWIQVAELTASDGLAGDWFGLAEAVSADGSTVVIGADKYQGGGTSTAQGAAYVFLRPSSGWATTSTFAAKLTASDGAANDWFGIKAGVSADGSTVVVGASRHQVGSNPLQGAVYVFLRPSSGWATTSTFAAELTASDGLAGDGLGAGAAVSADGSTVLAGAPGHQVSSNSEQGAAYVFLRPGSGWATTSTFAAELTASDGGASEQLGVDAQVSADGSTVVAGAGYHQVGSNSEQGAAYVFVKPGSGWATGTETAELTAPDGAANDFFGYSIAVSGDGSAVLAGAPGHQVSSNSEQGAAYVFLKPGSGWATTSTFAAELTASDGAAGDSLGDSVALSADGSAAFSGAPGRQVGSNTSQGAVYVFLKPVSGWATTSTFAAELTASDGAAGDGLGQSLALAVSADGSTVVAGAGFKAVGGNIRQGAAYVFAACPTTTRITSISPTGAGIGQDVTVSFTVTVGPPCSGTATGSVTVSDGTDSCVGVLTNGQGSCTLHLTVPATSVTASFPGDGFGGSTSGPVSLELGPTIPTLGAWGLLALAVLLGVAGLWVTARRT